MTFALPLMLAGMLLAAIPIAIHLINRRRAVRVRFAPLELLRRSQQQTARHIKVKQRVLLALRVALFLLLPLAMAQPFFSDAVDATSGSDRLPAAVVLVLDDSASMSAPVGGQTAFEAARAAALETIGELRAWDQVAVVVAGDEVVAPLATLADQHSLAADAVRELEPRWGRSNLSEALTVAQQVLATTQQPVRRVIVFSDNSASAWPTPATAPAGLGLLEIVDVADPASNLALADLQWAERPEAGAGAWGIEATVAAHNLASGQVEVTLSVGTAAVATAVADLVEGRATVAFTHNFGESDDPVPFSVSVADPVGAAADNTRWGLVSPRAAARVLLVNGDARSVQYNDELFFAQRALEAPFGTRQSVELTSTTPDRLGDATLENFDVIVLANVATVSSGEGARIEAFVRAGGGLLITAGDRMSVADFNANLANLMPRPLRDRRTLGAPGDPDLAIRATRVADTDSRHPVFSVFAAPGGETLQSAAIWAYMLIEPGTSDDVRTLASLGDGAPILLERLVGSGSVLMLLTSVDLDWTDLPVRTAYLPLMHRMVEHLARRSAGTALATDVGQRRTIDVTTWRAERVAVDDAAGDQSMQLATDGIVRVPVHRAGPHQVSLMRGEELARAPLLDFVANNPADESGVANLDAAALERLVRDAAVGVATAEGARTAGRSIWPALLFVALIVLYVETAVAARRRVWERLAERFGRAAPQAPLSRTR